jgi:hypothetical protein
MSFVLGSVQDEMVPMNIPFPPIVLSIIYMIIALIYIVPVIFLNTFCNNVIKAAKHGSSGHLTASLRSLKNLFVFIGVSTVVILSIYLISLVVVGVGAIMGL